MRRRTLPALAVAAALLVPSSACAATLTSPADGASYTTETHKTFVGLVADDEPDQALVFSQDPVVTPDGRWLSVGARSAPDGRFAHRVDLGWVASKFGGPGRFYWTLCTSQPDGTIATCAPPRTLTIRLVHPTVTARQGRSYTRSALRQDFAADWRGGYGHRVSCRRVSRLRQSCRYQWMAGDTVFSGRTVIYRKRRFGYSAVMYRTNHRVLGEYCLVVLKRPRSECERTYRRAGQIG